MSGSLIITDALHLLRPQPVQETDSHQILSEQLWRSSIWQMCMSALPVCLVNPPLSSCSSSPPQGAIYGMAQSIPDRSMVTEISRGFLDCLYSTEVPMSNVSHMNGNGKAHWGPERHQPPPPPTVALSRDTTRDPSAKRSLKHKPSSLLLISPRDTAPITVPQRLPEEMTASKHIVVFLIRFY